jgi:hypothetical protein
MGLISFLKCIKIFALDDSEMVYCLYHSFHANMFAVTFNSCWKILFINLLKLLMFGIEYDDFFILQNPIIISPSS